MAKFEQFLLAGVGDPYEFDPMNQSGRHFSYRFSTPEMHDVYVMFSLVKSGVEQTQIVTHAEKGNHHTILDNSNVYVGVMGVNGHIGNHLERETNINNVRATFRAIMQDFIIRMAPDLISMEPTKGSRLESRMYKQIAKKAGAVFPGYSGWNLKGTSKIFGPEYYAIVRTDSTDTLEMVMSLERY